MKEIGGREVKNSWFQARAAEAQRGERSMAVHQGHTAWERRLDSNQVCDHQR